jgi:hypothetical protein
MAGSLRYDIVGDIHGHADALEALLAMHGYREQNGVWRHRDRQMIFVGDFVDRGPKQVRVFEIARAMIDAGSARAVMGNHEFNMVGFATEHPPGSGQYLRERSAKNTGQHKAFLDAAGVDTHLHHELAQWCRSLPFWLELPGFRVVHACWHEPSMKALKLYLDEANRLTDAGMFKIFEHGTEAHDAVAILTGGIEARLPLGKTFCDKDGHRRDAVRLKWWDKRATTFLAAALIDDKDILDAIPDEPLPIEAVVTLDAGKPVFFGHYWLTGKPRLDSDQAACLDFSVAKGGVLCSYTWDGEEKLDKGRLSWVHQGASA